MSSEDLLGRCLGNTVGEREADALLEQLLEVRALDVGGLLNLNNLEDLDDTVSIQVRPATRRATYVNRPEARAVAGSHVLVERVDSLGPRHLAVLLVHVVGT